MMMIVSVGKRLLNVWVAFFWGENLWLCDGIVRAAVVLVLFLKEESLSL